jgi:cystathionine beta-lyase
MAYNFEQTPKRRQPGVLNKWTWFPNEVLPMWIADMDFSAPAPILEALHNYVEHGDLGYSLPSQKLYETVAARLDKLYGWKVSPDMLVAVPGVNSGYNVAARTFCTSRKGYLIQTPVFNEFHQTRKKAGVPQVEAPLAKTIDGNRIAYEVDFDSLRQAAKKVNIFLLCNPHNPIGTVHTTADLKRMAEICIENDVLIVSDEIHSELLLENHTFQPIAALSREIQERSITLISASKAYNVPGLFSAFAVIPEKKLRDQFTETLGRMGLHLSAPGLVASQIAYSGRCDPWLRALRKYLTGNRDFLVEYVGKIMPGVRVTIPQATFLAWLDFTQLDFVDSPYQFFFEKAKVALSDGALFGQNGQGHVRLNFGTSRRILKQGMDRLNKALRSR